MRLATTHGRLDLNGGPWSFTTPIPADHWKAEHFTNVDPAGTPARVEDEGDGPLKHYWTQAGPWGLSLFNFSSRFTRTVTFEAARYEFTLHKDDGARLFIDGQLRIDGWTSSNWQHPAEIDLTGGPHVLVVEHHQHAQAAWVRLEWAAAPPPPSRPRWARTRRSTSAIPPGRPTGCTS